jgi:hypothetical protein
LGLGPHQHPDGLIDLAPDSFNRYLWNVVLRSRSHHTAHGVENAAHHHLANIFIQIHGDAVRILANLVELRIVKPEMKSPAIVIELIFHVRLSLRRLKRAGAVTRPGSISLSVIAAPGCTANYFYTENFLGQILTF